MSRKDYETIAVAVRAVFDAATTPDGLHAIQNLITTMSRQFAADNPRFDPVRFANACTERTTTKRQPRSSSGRSGCTP